jgi:hypothetical protein
MRSRCRNRAACRRIELTHAAGRQVTASLLQLVFHGECLDGHDPVAVRRAVVKALKLDEKRAARLFSGQRVVLRREVSAAAAERHIARFAQMGALVHAEPSQPRTRRPKPAPTRDARPARAGAAWPRPLRWAAVGMVGSAVALMLGVALWPQAPAHIAASATDTTAGLVASAIVSPVTAPTKTTAAAPPQAASEADDIPHDMSAEALREYRQGYVHARGHKAFAISSGGAHAWHAGANTANEASEGALASCMQARRAGDEGCRIVELDGQWQE